LAGPKPGKNREAGPFTPTGDHIVLSCKDVSELVSQSQDRPLSLGERWRVWIHLKACGACRNLEKQMVFLRKAYRNHPLMKDRRD
jgi:hypothetical protein